MHGGLSPQLFPRDTEGPSPAPSAAGDPKPHLVESEIPVVDGCAHSHLVPLSEGHRAQDISPVINELVNLQRQDLGQSAAGTRLPGSQTGTGVPRCPAEQRCGPGHPRLLGPLDTLTGQQGPAQGPSPPQEGRCCGKGRRRLHYPGRPPPRCVGSARQTLWSHGWTDISVGRLPTHPRQWRYPAFVRPGCGWPLGSK